MISYLIKHFAFIFFVFVTLFALFYATGDVALYRFANLTASFLSILTTFLLLSSIYLSRGSTASTNILMGGIVFKMLISIGFFVVYAMVIKSLNVAVVMMFVLQYFLFTGWLLYLLLQYFNLKDKNAESVV